MQCVGHGVGEDLRFLHGIPWGQADADGGVRFLIRQPEGSHSSADVPRTGGASRAGGDADAPLREEIKESFAPYAGDRQADDVIDAAEGLIDTHRLPVGGKPLNN